jgi:hypothetical protein
MNHCKPSHYTDLFNSFLIFNLRGSFGLILALTASAALFPQAKAWADDTTDSVTAAENTALRTDPGGNEAALLHGGIGVKTLETRGEWSRIQVNGWVRTDQIKKGVAKGSAVAASSVSLTDFSIQELSKMVTGNKRAVKLTLTLRNDSPKPINSWKGMLLVSEKLVQGMKGDIVLRVPVSDKNKPVAAGATFSSEYFWYEDQGPFGVLNQRTNKTLAIDLIDVRAE